MSSLNKWCGIGNVAKEPEVRYTNDNKPVASFSMACNESYKDKSGNKQESCEFVNIVIFGGLAGVVEKYVHKGSKLYIEGSLKTRKYTDKNGNDKYITEIVVNGFNGNMIMLGDKQQPNQPANEDDILF